MREVSVTSDDSKSAGGEAPHSPTRRWRQRGSGGNRVDMALISALVTLMNCARHVSYFQRWGCVGEAPRGDVVTQTTIGISWTVCATWAICERWGCMWWAPMGGGVKTAPMGISGNILHLPRHGVLHIFFSRRAILLASLFIKRRPANRHTAFLNSLWELWLWSICHRATPHPSHPSIQTLFVFEEIRSLQSINS